MTPEIIVGIVVGCFVLFMLVLIVMLSRSPTARAKNYMKVLDYDPNTDLLKYFGIDRKKGVQHLGHGMAVYQPGLFGKEHTISSRGYREFNFTNATLVVPQRMLDKLDLRMEQKLLETEEEYNRLINFYSYAMTRVNQQNTDLYKEMERMAESMGVFKEKLLPKFVIGRSGAGGMGGAR